MPKSIKYFEICILVSLVIKLILSALPINGGNGFYGEDAFVIIFIVILLSAYLTFFISRKGNFSFIPLVLIKGAKGILIILFIVNSFLNFSILSEIYNFYIYTVLIATTFLSIEFIIQGIGIYFLFTEESRAWFEKSDKAE